VTNAAHDTTISTRPAAVLLTVDPRTASPNRFAYHRVETAEPDIILVSRDRSRAMGV
jgi:hypothetical protein